MGCAFRVSRGSVPLIDALSLRHHAMKTHTHLSLGAEKLHWQPPRRSFAIVYTHRFTFERDALSPAKK